jgi:hypothetical protein
VARLGRVFSKRDHEFESAFLQQRVQCEPDFSEHGYETAGINEVSVDDAK